MTTPSRDDLAREAARRLAEGAAETIDDALVLAERSLGAGPRPGHALVRRHWQGLLMQRDGAEGYLERCRRIWRIAEEVLSTLETLTDDAPVYLVGRAARGLIDGPVTLHVRVYSDLPAGDLARGLEACGYAPPTFETADTRHGRLDGLRLLEGDLEISIVRCLPALLATVDRNLYADEPIARVTVEDVRQRCSASS